VKQVNHNPELLKVIDQLLTRNTAGLTEYELMDALDKHNPELFPKPNFTDKLLMFQHHFFLRHCLYQLQLQYAQEQRFQLDISLVTLIKRPAIEASQQTTEYDPLRDYYLDLSNMNKESHESVDELLKSFWSQLTHSIAAPDAHKTLGLTGSESHQQKQQRYRQLAQKHHPDKGGDSQTFNEIQQAWQTIRKR
jgi:DnaJ-domain-containing protein 1